MGLLKKLEQRETRKFGEKKIKAEESRQNNFLKIFKNIFNKVGKLKRN